MKGKTKPRGENIEELLRSFNELAVEKALAKLETTATGLTEKEVKRRRAIWGENEVISRKRAGIFRELAGRFASPLVITLLVVAGLSFFLGEKISAVIVIMMAVLSVILTFVQEHKAERNAEKLKEMVHITTHVLRDGALREVKLSELVPGDLVELSAGDMVPSDLRVIVAKDLTVNQSALNGESLPVDKHAVRTNTSASSLYDLDAIACMGSSVVSGTAHGVIIRTGQHTHFGQLSQAITAGEPETAFDRGIRQFTWMMISLILVLTITIFIINALLKNAFVESLLFSLAVAVGLAPEMLPMIVTVNLSKGAIAMAKKQVIIKRLDAIQNFGAMDVLCTDKTGTLTLDQIALVKFCDTAGRDNEHVLREAFINSSFQTGLNNLLDRAVLHHRNFDLHGVAKIDEIPFDFSRKIMSVVVRDGAQAMLIAKGAPEEIFTRSNRYRNGNSLQPLTPAARDQISRLYAALSSDGFRVLAVASKSIAQPKTDYEPEDEVDLAIDGFVAFLDPPKPTAKDAIHDLRKLGVQLKILSGDNEMVNQKICSEVGLGGAKVLSGREVEAMNDDALGRAVETTTVFARVLPMQKERIIRALQHNCHIVGFLGDGINDAPALKSADVGISVDNAVDIARETADIIVLQKGLRVLADCVREGRKTFANTLKYIKMGASSNFGNMVSMTGASLFLPFLPMLPTQILLNNFLYDLSQVTIPSDSVDDDYLIKPRPWDIKYIREFILTIGPVSSLFDFVTFFVMWKIFNAAPEMFRTGWFVESLFTQTLVIHIIRTNKIPFIGSRPSRLLLWSTLAVVAAGCVIPYSPLSAWFGFTPLPLRFFGILAGIAFTYLLLTQFVKSWFIKKFGFE
ncbi:MAG: magnesium-translocating P-type ATPase [Patescibacteria group bacterium]|nr:magnesium-translocating P-type ATPase [Patescibacteria group bacterium]